ncbi:hypothetical protein STEG23_003498, partial [Scotinomys teguina]
SPSSCTPALDSYQLLKYNIVIIIIIIIIIISQSSLKTLSALCNLSPPSHRLLRLQEFDTAIKCIEWNPWKVTSGSRSGELVSSQTSRELVDPEVQHSLFCHFAKKIPEKFYLTLPQRPNTNSLKRFPSALHKRIRYMT